MFQNEGLFLTRFIRGVWNSKLKGSWINRETWHFLGNTTDAGLENPCKDIFHSSIKSKSACVFIKVFNLGLIQQVSFQVFF